MRLNMLNTLRETWCDIKEFLGIDPDLPPIDSELDTFLYDGVKDMEEVYVNGDLDHRIAGNINISFNYVEGESLLMALSNLAISSGSACTSASLEPSYVLRALGRNDELAHSSIRFTMGRYTTEEEVDRTIEHIRKAVDKLRELSPLWDMYKDGIDLDSIEWAAH